MNKDIFNFLRVIYKSLTDFPIIIIDERLYGEALFYQNEMYSNTYMDRIILEKFLNSTHSDKLHHDYSYTTTTQQEHKGARGKVCFIIYTLNFKNDFLIKYFKEISQKDIERILKMNSKETLHENIYFQNNIS